MADLRIKPYSATTWTTISDVAYLSCNWEVNRAGMLTATLPVSQMAAALRLIQQNPTYASVTTLVGMLVEFSDEAAGKWGGQIMQVGAIDGLATISAMSYEILFRKKLFEIAMGSTSRTQENRQHPSAVMNTILDKYNNAGGDDAPHVKFEKGSTYTTTGDIDVRINVIGDAYDEIIPQITDDIGWEYNVDADRKVQFGPSLGTDKSATVTLTEGVHIVHASWQDDLLPMTNSLKGFCTVQVGTNIGTRKETWTATPTNWTSPESTTDSIKQFGVLRERRDYPAITTLESLKRSLRNEVRVTSLLQPLITVEVVNVSNCWSRFRQGDTIRLELGDSGYSGKFRVIVRSLDVTRGVMVCSGLGDLRKG